MRLRSCYWRSQQFTKNLDWKIQCPDRVSRIYSIIVTLEMIVQVLQCAAPYLNTMSEIPIYYYVKNHSCLFIAHCWFESHIPAYNILLHINNNYFTPIIVWRQDIDQPVECSGISPASNKPSTLELTNSNFPLRSRTLQDKKKTFQTWGMFFFSTKTKFVYLDQ